MVNSSVLDVHTSSKVSPRSFSTLDCPYFFIVFVQVLFGGAFVHMSKSFSASWSSRRLFNLHMGLWASGQGRPFSIYGQLIPALTTTGVWKNLQASRQMSLFHSILGNLMPNLTSSWFFPGSAAVLGDGAYLFHTGGLNTCTNKFMVLRPMAIFQRRPVPWHSKATVAAARSFLLFSHIRIKPCKICNRSYVGFAG